MQATYSFEDLEFEVEYSISFGRAGRYYGKPEDCYEAEPDEVDYEIEGYADAQAVVVEWFKQEYLSRFESEEDCNQAIIYLSAYIESQDKLIKKCTNKLEDDLFDYLIEQGREWRESELVERAMNRRRGREEWD